MNDTFITLLGNVVSDIRSVTTTNGVPMARFRLGVSPRKYDRESQQWTYRESSFYTIVAWRRLAEHTLCSVERGDPLVVTGRLSIREWERDDRWYTCAEVEAWTLGHDLARGTSQFTRLSRRRPPTEEEARSTDAEPPTDTTTEPTTEPEAA